MFHPIAGVTGIVSERVPTWPRRSKCNLDEYKDYSRLDLMSLGLDNGPTTSELATKSQAVLPQHDQTFEPPRPPDRAKSHANIKTKSHADLKAKKLGAT